MISILARQQVDTHVWASSEPVLPGLGAPEAAGVLWAAAALRADRAAESALGAGCFRRPRDLDPHSAAQVPRGVPQWKAFHKNKG